MATLSSSNVTTTLGQYVYDANGNLSQAYELSGTTLYDRDSQGNPTQITDGSGRYVSVSGSAAIPSSITPGGTADLATSISYASSWAVTSVTGPNSATATTAYDAYGRPSSSTSADGAVTSYTYTYVPNTQTAAVGTQWKRTTLDGFGRVLSVQVGHGSTTDPPVSTVDTQYAPCGCSPLGKMWRVSLPYAPGGTQVWTTYTYDTSGRTLTVTKPDNASTTHYAYAGNTTTVTDPAGKWKKFTTDALGNLTQVTEPDPANPASATYVTTYAYNAFNQLTGVTMPRGNITQTRSFTWSGSDLASATNPENGTVSYQYDSAHHVTQRTAAKGQVTTYEYDAYGRLTTTHHFPTAGQEDLNQRVTYGYDSGTNGWGRLAQVTFKDQNGNGTQFQYLYSYNAAGRIVWRRMAVGSTNFDSSYTWDNQGRMTSRTDPPNLIPDDGSTPNPYTYQYDAMGNLTSVANSADTVATATYNFAGQMTSLNNQTFSYNSLMQLSGTTATQWGNTTVNLQYNYTAGQNNGRLLSSKDNISGETITYAYDALNRLASAPAPFGPLARPTPRGRARVHG